MVLGDHTQALSIVGNKEGRAFGAQLLLCFQGGLKHQRPGDVVQLVRCLPSMDGALGSVPGIAENGIC